MLLPRSAVTDIDAAAGLLKEFRPATLPRIYLNQRFSEWKRFLQFLQKRGFPQTILEIGTGRGGSTFFWSRFSPAGARVVTVDIAERAAQLVKIYDRPSVNSVHCITGDSRSAETIGAVRRALDGRAVDLLYIDGDHTYAGVKSDYERFALFCGESSLIAFHDIHPDFFHARGVQTPCDSGDVYRFWDELKARHVFHDFVEEPRAEMDGFGIGVIEYRRPG
ncbi:MAG TPA: class I SAM-dependent methyltransferase [Tepidisphaeraceae bacterium]|nr:class I SAM-dependent methyltransferase [Tepidisphaeraceae bacterium]